MRLTIVGCSGSFPGPDSPASCYLVEAPHDGRTYRLLLDLGNGALGHLQRHIDPLDVDAVAVSHLHPDHFFDLASFYVYRRYHPKAPHPKLPVYGPSNMAARLARAYDLPEQPGMTEEFDFTTWPAAGPVALGPFEVRVARVAHPVESYGMRISAGGSTLAYSGDTGPCDALESLADGADVLLAEAAFVESEEQPVDLHMTGRDAATHAARAGARRLLLTHIPPWTDPAEVLADAQPVFDGPMELVEPGASYDI
ncbi:MAG TPA: MBL fold metallo-hydrolase [Nocardioidaceae bacterium]|nr:MBL fold metallo-hydrolase [Nocardioidaceae bacterium]